MIHLKSNTEFTDQALWVKMKAFLFLGMQMRYEAENRKCMHLTNGGIQFLTNRMLLCHVRVSQ